MVSTEVRHAYLVPNVLQATRYILHQTQAINFLRGRGSAGGRRAATHARARLGILVAAIGRVVGSGVDGVVGGRIDTDGDPGKDTVGNGITKEDVLNNGVDVISLARENAVLGVQRPLLSVGAVGLESLNLGEQILVEKELTNVSSVGTAGDSAVGQERPRAASVSEDMNVVCTRGVVSGDDRDELEHTILIGGLDTAKECLVEVGGIGGIAVAAGCNTRIDTGCVAVPEVQGNILQGLTGVGVDNLDIQVQRDALLILGDVLAEQLSDDVCETFLVRMMLYS